MTDKIKQTIKDGIEKLPKEVRETVNNFDWEKVSEEIGGKHFLDGDEINILQNEIGLVLIETKDQNILVLNIENNVGTSKNEAVKMTEEIKQKIFKPMFEKMEETAKNNSILDKPNWKQTVDFIISGGDYSVFIEKTENMSNQKVSYGEVI